jgi:hypothetical protein
LYCEGFPFLLFLFEFTLKVGRAFSPWGTNVGLNPPLTSMGDRQMLVKKAALDPGIKVIKIATNSLKSTLQTHYQQQPKNHQQQLFPQLQQQKQKLLVYQKVFQNESNKGQEKLQEMQNIANQITFDMTMNPTSLFTPKEGQREKARRIACGCPAGSLGKDAICPNLNLWYIKLVRNFAAGKVGDHYQEYINELKADASDENIQKWAEQETEFFRSQSFFSKIVGGILSTEDRVNWLKYQRDKSKRIP